MIVELAGETGCVKWNLCCNSKIEHCYIEQSVAHMLEQFQGEQHHDIKERFQFEDCVRMSLMKIAEEREDCDPMEGLEGRGEGSTRRRGEEAEGRNEGNEEKEDELEEWKRGKSVLPWHRGELAGRGIPVTRVSDMIWGRWLI